ncbi:MAG: hypothetical protein WC119_01615 [Synergistaceae bacterium]
MKRVYKSKLNVEELIGIGESFGLEFYLPPFEGDINECSFDVHEFKDTPKFQEFIHLLDKLKIKYEYAKDKINKKFFIIIDKGELNGI